MDVAMIEANKTTASAGEIWAIVVVAVCCLAFWLTMINWADRNPLYKHRQVPDMPGPVLGGIHLAAGGRSVAPSREAPAVLTDEEEEVEEEYREYEMAGASQAGGTPAEGRPFVPGQRDAQPQQAPTLPAQPQAPAEQAGTVADMPTQRTGKADRAQRSATGPGDQRGDEN
jgi:hypothetical protein